MAFLPPTSLAWRLWRRLVRTQVSYFAVPEVMPDADVLKLCDLPVPYPGVYNHYRPTIQIDLSQSEDVLFKALAPAVHKAIRQAARGGIVIETLDEISEDVWDAFLSAHQKLRQRKPMAGALGVGQVRDLMKMGAYELSRSRDGEGNILSWHSYVVTHGRARLQTTMADLDPAQGSVWNNHVGRAHRLHHWKDILRYKARGLALYDFGGVYRGKDDPEQMQIAYFKQLFGGVFADTYDAVIPLSRKGRLALSLVSHVSAESRAGGRVIGAHA
ncbi:MAG: hypothetical protein P4L57_13825 [Rhizomicrobium sp.]|nr:hypothetical protein [Rhizomicrobium sp.]